VTEEANSTSFAKRGQIFVITGPSGVGKGTLCARLLADDDSLVLSISATSRAPRTGEQDGVNYHFYSAADFQAMVEHDKQESDIEQHQLLEWAQYNGNYYGTPRAAVEVALDSGRHVLLEIETKGAFQIKEAFPEARLIFIAPPSLEVLEQRLRTRGTEVEAEIENRLAISKEELKLQGQFDYELLNNSLDACLAELKAIIAS
jgi:guanylate kinase